MKTVVITGGVRGIGRAAALMFAERGYAVAACYEKNGAAADALSAALRETGVPFLVSRADVSDASAVGAFVAAASRLTGKVDVLVNNAGISSFGLFQELKEDAFDRLFAVNCKGAYLAAREVLPGMISRREGSIVNVSSVWGITGASCEAAYSASKAWLIGLTRALAKEAGPSGVRHRHGYERAPRGGGPRRAGGGDAARKDRHAGGRRAHDRLSGGRSLRYRAGRRGGRRVFPVKRT